jgi:hypothetical protein
MMWKSKKKMLDENLKQVCSFVVAVAVAAMAAMMMMMMMMWL